MKYLICVTNRVGSSWLCSMLASTGIAGNPLEHFNLPEARWSIFPEHYDEICRMDPLGIKTSYQGLMRAISLVGELEFAETPCVFLRRRDTLAQAISNYRAMRTGQWWRRPGDPVKTSDESLEGDVVMKLKREYEYTNDHLWTNWLDNRRVPPLRLFYEDMCDDPAGMVHTVCNFLGVGRPSQVDTGRFVIQRDALSARWQEQLERR